MQKGGFSTNDIMKMNIEKATLIPHTNVTHGIDDLNETYHGWMV